MMMSYNTMSYNTVETQTQQGQRQLPGAMSAAQGPNPGQKVLAERYKTKVCKNYIEMGMCPYESRCMFAHGDDELRTADENLRDGIVTEDSIRHFKRMQAYKVQAQQAAQQATCGPPSYEHSSFVEGRQRQAYHGGSGAYESPNLSRNNSSHCMAFNGQGDSFCYDPYGWTPYHNPANPNCECADCLYTAEVEYSSQHPTHQRTMVPPTPTRSSSQAENEAEEAEVEKAETLDVAPAPYCTPAGTTQADVAGHSLRRPMMP